MLPFPDNHILTNHIFRKKLTFEERTLFNIRNIGIPVVNHHALSNGEYIPAGAGKAKPKSGGDGDDGNNDDHHVRVLLHLA